MALRTKQGKAIVTTQSAHVPGGKPIKEVAKTSPVAELTTNQVSAIEAGMHSTTVEILGGEDRSEVNDVSSQSSSSDETIEISSLSDIPEPLKTAGINPLRAELLGILEMLPQQDIENTGMMLKELVSLRQSTRNLYTENVALALQAFKSSFGSTHQKQVEKYNEGAQKIDHVVSALVQLDACQKEMIDRLDLKKMLSMKPAGDIVRTYFVTELGFSESGYDSFSSSKIFCQLLSDLRRICLHYEIGFLDMPPSSRYADSDPMTINKVYSDNPSSFSLKKLGVDASNPISWGSSQDYKTIFIPLLPSTENSRIKLLLAYLSKELTSSAAISYYVLHPSSTPFTVSTTRAGDDPYTSALGDAGTTVTGGKYPPGSLASFVQLDVPNQSYKVLPFETRVFSKDSKTTFRSGADYFVKKIIRDVAEGTNTTFTQSVASNDYRGDPAEIISWSEDLIGTAVEAIEYVTAHLGVVNPKENALSQRSAGPAGLTSVISMLSPKGDANNQRYPKKYSLPSYEGLQLQPEEIYKRMLVIINKACAQLRDDTTYSALALMTAALINEAATSNDLRAYLFNWLYNIYVVRSLLVYSQMDPSDRPKNLPDVMPFWTAALTAADDIVQYVNSSAAESPLRTNAGKKDNDIIAEDRNSADSVNLQALLNPLVGGTRGFISPASPLEDILDEFSTLTRTASKLAEKYDENGSPYVQTGTWADRKTTYHGIPDAGLLAMFFEAYVSLFSQHVTAEVSEGYTRGTLRSYVLAFNATKNGRLMSALNDIMGDIPHEGIPSDFTDLGNTRIADYIIKGNLNTQMNMLGGSYKVLVRGFVALDYLIGGLDQAVNSFMGKLWFPSLPENQTPSQKALAFLANGSSLSKSILGGLSEAQIILTKEAKHHHGRLGGTDLVGSTPSQVISYLPRRSIFLSEEMRLLKAFTQVGANAHAAYPTEILGESIENRRVLAVGIPCGFIQAMTELPYTLGEGSPDRIDVKQKVVEVSIFKRDLTHEDIVFKPRKFLFDPMLFVSRGAFKSSQGSGTDAQAFNQAVSKYMKFRKYDSVQTLRLKTHEELRTPAGGYTALTAHEVHEICWNTASSYFLGVYYKLLFGLEVNDFTFSQQPDLSRIFIDDAMLAVMDTFTGNTDMEKVLPIGSVAPSDLAASVSWTGVDSPKNFRYVKNFADISSLLEPGVQPIDTAGRPTTELVPPALTREQFENFGQFCSSRIVNPRSMATQVLCPRLFDRVFLIPLDPDTFEIDRVATLNSEIGSSAFEKIREQDLVVAAVGINKFKHPFQASPKSGYFLRPTRGSEYDYSDYFVQVSLKEKGV